MPKASSGTRCSTVAACSALRRTEGSTGRCNCQSADPPLAPSAAPILRRFTSRRRGFALRRTSSPPKSMPADCWRWTSGLRVCRSRFIPAEVSWLHDAKAVQGQFLVDIVEDDFDTLTDLDLSIAAANDARCEPWPLVQLDLHDVVWRFILERREPCLVNHRPGTDAPEARSRLPSDVVGEAERADRPRRQMRLAARTAGRQHQTMRATAAPEWLRVPADARARLFIGGHGCKSPYAARMNESPHAVPHCSTAALAIWLAPAAPRNCLTISQIEFHPAIWASDRRPPEVLMGSAPPSSIRPPWTHAAASPAPQ